MAYRLRPLSLLAAVLACAVIGAALPAGASGQVSCGAVITSDVRLDSNLECLPIEQPITIGADRVTVDLNGHQIVGFVVLEGHDRVTIRDGGILALQLRDAHRNRLLNLALFEVGLTADGLKPQFDPGKLLCLPVRGLRFRWGPARTAMGPGQSHRRTPGWRPGSWTGDRNEVSGNIISRT